VSEPDLRSLIMGNPVARAFAITGDAWTQLIMREAFYGVRRFGIWRERLGTPRSVLTDRLQKLVAAGLLQQSQIDTGLRTEYRLTEMGMDLFGVAVMQGQWERHWARSPLQERYAIAYFDRTSGARLRPGVLTRPNGAEITANQVTWKADKGLDIIDPPTSRRRRSAPLETDRPLIDRSVDIMGDYWSWAVLSATYFRLRKFDEIHAALGVATNILADRLSRLVLQGVLEKRPYQTAPLRYEYRLTEAGRALYPIFLAMHGWAVRWLVNKGEAPLTLIDSRDGQGFVPLVCDLNTGLPLDPRQIRWEIEDQPTPA